MKITRRHIRQVILEEMTRLNENTDVRKEVIAALWVTGQAAAAVAYGLSSSVREKMNSAFDEGEDILKNYIEKQKADWSKVLN